MSLNLRKLDSTDSDFASQLKAVLAFEASEDEAIDQAAARILAAVRQEGDAAVLRFTSQFDRVQADSVAALEIGHAQLQASLDKLPAAQRAALQTAADRVRAYHERQSQECSSD